MDKDTIEKLLEISDEQWKSIIKKCYGHIDIKLYGKMNSGAHCEQRLGMPAHDYYFGRACESIYSGIWHWNYEKFNIEEQIIRIIDSMISEQVRKYKVEMKHNKKTILVGTEQLFIFDNQKEKVDDIDETYSNKLSTALKMACNDNQSYKSFIELKCQNLSYHEICKEMQCTIKEAYRMRDAIAKKAKTILNSL